RAGMPGRPMSETATAAPRVSKTFAGEFPPAAGIAAADGSRFLKPNPPLARSSPPMESAPPRSPTPVPASAADELEWVARARQGDQSAYRRLVERHRARAYGLAL